MSISNGNSFDLSNGQSMNASQSPDPGTYPEPWYIQMLGPVQPGAVR